MKTQMTEITILNHNKEKLDFFSYSQNMVRCYGTPENPLFCAKDIATILGYKNLQQAIRKNVDEEDRFQLGCYAGALPNQQPNLTLINESGLYSLLLRSKKKEAKPFRRWVTSEVLPAIRKKGFYSTTQQQSASQEISTMMDTYLKFEQLQRSCGNWDSRTRLLVSDLSTNLLLGNTEQLTIVKKGRLAWSVSRRLSEVYCITSKVAHKKLASFGRIIAKRYREIYNEDPPKHEQFVNGAVRRVNTYYEEHYELYFDDMIEEYFSDFLKYEDEDEDEE